MLKYLRYLKTWFIFVRHNVNGKSVLCRGNPKITNRGTINIGSGTIINSGSRYNPVSVSTSTIITVDRGASLSVGNRAGISNSVIYCTHNICIGNRTFIGAGCQIWDSDFHSLNYRERSEKVDPGIKSLGVRIGDDCLIGGSSIILKGVKIGDKSVVGAGSVVTRNIPSGEVWAGNPASKIKEIGQS